MNSCAYFLRVHLYAWWKLFLGRYNAHPLTPEREYYLRVVEGLRDSKKHPHRREADTTLWPQATPLEFPAQPVSSRIPEALPSLAQLLSLLPGENLPSYCFPRHGLSFTSWILWVFPSCREGFSLEETAVGIASHRVSSPEDFCKIVLFWRWVVKNGQNPGEKQREECPGLSPSENWQRLRNTQQGDAEKRYRGLSRRRSYSFDICLKRTLRMQWWSLGIGLKDVKNQWKSVKLLWFPLLIWLQYVWFPICHCNLIYIFSFS